MQRIDFGVGVIGDLGISRVDRAALTRIRDHASLRAKSNATRNRYIMAAHAVLSYAENEGLITAAPKSPMLDERVTRKYRDILSYGQDEAIIAKMVELGFERRGQVRRDTDPDRYALRGTQEASARADHRGERARREGTEHECGVVRLKQGQTKNNKMRV
jgi:hypothetical protein